MSSYAGGRGEALPWGLVLVEGIVVALFGLILLVAPGASLVFLVLAAWHLPVDSGHLPHRRHLFRFLFLGLEAGRRHPEPHSRLGDTQQPSVEHHPGLYVVGHLGGVPGHASGRRGPDSCFPRRWLEHGSLVRARHPLGPFLGDQPPDRGGGANVDPGDLHAHWGSWSGASGIQDA